MCLEEKNILDCLLTATDSTIFIKGISEVKLWQMIQREYSRSEKEPELENLTRRCTKSLNGNHVTEAGLTDWQLNHLKGTY